jgi:hypothetical protein
MASQYDEAKSIDWQQLQRRVWDWAREHCPDDLNYGTAYSYWRNAREAGFVTKAEYDYAEARYGNLWHYRGD